MQRPEIWIGTKQFEVLSAAPGGKRRAEHAAGMELLRQGLLECYGIEKDFLALEPASQAGADASGSIGRGPHGKPYLIGCPEIHFNISHCDGLAACAIDSRPVGIDVERIRPCRDSLLLRVLSEHERQQVEAAGSREEQEERFFRFWTLKESYLKAVGCGITASLTSVEFTLADGENGEIGCSVPGYLFWQERIFEDVILSVCTVGGK